MQTPQIVIEVENIIGSMALSAINCAIMNVCDVSLSLLFFVRNYVFVIRIVWEGNCVI